MSRGRRTCCSGERRQCGASLNNLRGGVGSGCGLGGRGRGWRWDLVVTGRGERFQEQRSGQCVPLTLKLTLELKHVSFCVCVDTFKLVSVQTKVGNVSHRDGVTSFNTTSN